MVAYIDMNMNINMNILDTVSCVTTISAANKELFISKEMPGINDILRYKL